MSEHVTTEQETRPAQLNREYVVGGDFWWYRGQRARGLALPWAVDDVTQDFGEDLYDRMEQDSRVAACGTLFRAAVLEDGATLSPAVDDREKDGYEQSVELVEFCQPMLEDLESSLDNVLWDLLGCIGRGNRVAEIIYHPLDASPLPGRAVLRDLVVKPRQAVAFVVDPYMRLLGLLGRTEDAPTQPMVGGLVDPATATNLLPREKFLVATFRPENGDPRGTSAYRPAYTAWWMKMQMWQDYLKYLAQFASPIVVGKTAQGAKDVLKDGQVVRAVDALLEVLLGLRNGTALALAYGTDFELLFSQGEGKAFLNALQLFNHEIALAITTQILATGEGEHASRAQAGVHQDALDTIIKQMKRAICRMLRRDVLRHLVRYNFGDKLAALTPKVSLGETEAQDIAKLMTAVSQLTSARYLHDSQLAGVDRLLNLPPRIVAEGEPARPEPAPSPVPQPGTPKEEETDDETI